MDAVKLEVSIVELQTMDVLMVRVLPSRFRTNNVEVVMVDVPIVLLIRNVLPIILLPTSAAKLILDALIVEVLMVLVTTMVLVTIVLPTKLL